VVDEKSSDFYLDVLRALLKEGVLDVTMRILVACGGATDRDVFMNAGFTDVVISNLDTRMHGDEFSPFAWSFQDVERLSFEDNAFDFAVVHSGLHHCYSPHRGLLELYRVASKGVLLFEPYDSLFTRIGARLNFGQEYELAAVVSNGFQFGGVNNTAIPNYIYRLSESEIEKVVSCFAPYGKHRFQFIRKLRIPWYQLRNRKNKLYFIAVAVAFPLLALLCRLIPGLSNNFAAVILKPQLPADIHPWLTWEDARVKVNSDWLKEKYTV
jgi:SAM-dependent methyltransferase